MTRRKAALFSLSFSLVILVAAAVAGAANALFFAIIASAALGTVVIQLLFPKAGLFPNTFVNLIAVYTAIFSLFVDSIFPAVAAPVLGLGFGIPILFFIAGCWLRRGDVQAAVARAEIRGEKGLFRSLFWLIPIGAVGGAVYILSGVAANALDAGAPFLSAMLIIGMIVLSVSRDVAIFLVETGLLFDEFLARVSRMAVPAFAFLTSYALLVILFGAVYSILSSYSHLPHFRVNDIPRPISFSEAIYFSVVTISTVGYGDIVPASAPIRLLASLEIVCGVMLLLFGVSELLEYAREHRRRAHSLRHHDELE